MARKNRVPKTLDRKLRDLDDHLYFLKESLLKLSNGDGAYLKTLTVELRVLVCKASGTEGLLWRVIDELDVNDAVHVHLPGNLDREHPLARGLQFSFVPIFRAGQGDPRLPPAHYSLKSIIKECEALVVSGDGYSYEKVIRAVAEQMGSAHEDEGVEPHLIELSGMVISDERPLNTVLMRISDLVLEIGERVLDRATSTLNLSRKSRPEIVIPQQLAKSFPDEHLTDSEDTSSPLTPEGTVSFLLGHEDADWTTNERSYDFGLCKKGPLTIRTIKHPDKTIEVLVEGITESALSTRKPIPTSKDSRVSVAFSWSTGAAVFYLNGIQVDTAEFAI